jgi:glycosyltransferase involved in cell wall biosynthesis
VLVHLPLGDEHGASPQAARALAEAERATLHGVAGVVATSGWAARRVVDAHGLEPARVQVAEPGVDPAPLSRPAPGGGRLACVGSVTRTKGQDVLVEALAEVADLDWECALVGPLRRDPGQVAEVRSALDRHGLSARVRLTGPLPADRVAEVYAETDLLVLPSRAETYGMVLTEALARGVPVLAAAVGGVPETVGDTPDGPPGLLVDADDPSAVAAALRAWLTRPELRERLRDRARHRRGALSGWSATSRSVARALDRAPHEVTP